MWRRVHHLPNGLGPTIFGSLVISTNALTRLLVCTIGVPIKLNSTVLIVFLHCHLPRGNAVSVVCDVMHAA